MGDPLSVAASDCGIVSLGLSVCQSIVAFYQSYKGQNQDVLRTLRSTQGLLKILGLLDTTLKGLEFKSDEENVVRDIEDSITACTESIEELRTDLHKFEYSNDTSGFSAETVKKRLRKISYPFKESTLLKLRETIQDVRDNLGLAVECLGLRAATASNRDIQKVTSLLSSMRLGAIRSEITLWLKAPDPMINFNAACEKRHSQTGTWFIESPEFADWVSTPASFLWLNGFAGCGKTVLCSSIIQHKIEQHSSRQSSAVAFFFFDFRDVEKQTAQSMLRSLVLQLSCQSFEASSALEGLWNTYGLGAPPPDALLKVLKEMICTFDTVSIFLDALDEVPAGDRRDYAIRIINQIRMWSITRLHLLVTSRAETDIKSGLAPSSSEAVSIQNERVDEDIAVFVRSRLRSDPKLKKWSAHLSEIETTLIDGAKGMFRWVECQFESISSCRTPKKLHDSLQSLPKTLDETYERVLTSIDEESAQEALRLLTWLCFSERPLTIEEVTEALAIDFTEVPQYEEDNKVVQALDILDICPGFIVTGSATTHTKDFRNLEELAVDEITLFRLAHFSIKEYLVSTRISAGPAAYFRLSSELAHSMLAKCCVSYILHCNSTHDIFVVPMSMFDLGEYTAKYWSYHCRKANEDGTWLGLISGFFTAPGNACRALQWYYTELFSESRRVGITANEKRRPRTLADVSDSALFYAAFWGLAPLVSQFLADPTTNVDSAGTTPRKFGEDPSPISVLAAASYQGHLDVVQLLLEYGADPNYLPVDDKPRSPHHPTVHGASALQMACRAGHVEVAQLLLDSGARIDLCGTVYIPSLEIDSDSVVEPLNLAMSGDLFETARLLLSRGASPLIQENHSKRTPLHYAAEHANLRAIWLLLELGASRTIKDRDGRTPFHAAAARYGNDDDMDEVVKVFEALSYEGAITETDNSGRSALHLAISSWNEKLAFRLLTAGADTTIKDEKGRTPFLVAAKRNGSIELMQSLFYFNAASDCDITGRTALHLCVSAPTYNRIQEGKYYLESEDIDDLLQKVYWLLEIGCTMSAQDLKGNSVVHAAAKYPDWWPVVEMLMDYESTRTSRLHEVPAIDAVLAMLIQPNNEMETPLSLLEGFVSSLNLETLAENLASSPPSENSGIRIYSGEEEYVWRFQSMYDRSILSGTNCDQHPSHNQNYKKLLGSLALRDAITNQRWDMVHQLLKAEGIGFTSKSACLISLDAAAWFGISIGDVESIFGVQLVVHHLREYGSRLALAAAGRGHLVALMGLAHRGVALGCCDRTGTTLLSWAIAKNQTEVIQFLDSTGARLDGRSGRVREGIRMAAMTGNLDILDYVSRNGFSFEEYPPREGKDSNSPLHWAVLNAHERFVEHLVRLRHPLELLNDEGETALVAACQKGLSETVNLLLTNGASIDDTEDFYDMDALSVASQAGFLEIVQALIARGADHTKVFSSDGLDIIGRCEFWLRSHPRHSLPGEDQAEARSRLQAVTEYLKTLRSSPSQ